MKVPNTAGKVVIHTSHGDLDIELWSKECPKACRNFVQLCMEGYYNNLLFHRVIPDFMIQGGCKAGTGETCESIYDAPFPVEKHGRLQFRNRGMVGVANAGKGTDTNGSQFFITLARADFLTNSHTLFGKVGGNTLYNLVRIGEVEVDKTDRPVDDVVIRSTEVIWNPYDDIVPRCVAPETQPTQTNERKPIEAVQNKKMLSFEDSDEDEEEDNKKKISSAHDALKDSRLVSQPVCVDNLKTQGEEVPKEEDDERGSPRSPSSSSSRNPQDRVERKRAERQATIAQLEEDIRCASSKKGDEIAPRTDRYEQLRRKYKVGGKDKESRKRKGEQELDALKVFATRLKQSKAVVPEKVVNVEKPRADNDKPEPEAGTFADIYDGYEEFEDEDLSDWANSGLKFHVTADKAFQLAETKKAAAVSFDALKTNDLSAVALEASHKRMRDVIEESRKKK